MQACYSMQLIPQVGCEWRIFTFWLNCGFTAQANLLLAGKGYITRSDLAALFAAHMPWVQPDVQYETFKAADADRDNRVSYPEFVNLLRMQDETAARIFSGQGMEQGHEDQFW